MRTAAIDWVIVLSIALAFFGNAHAQKQSEKTLLQQLDEAEENEKRKNFHQGQTQAAGKTIQRARENAKSEASTCPSGSRPRKIEDVREYLIRQDALQQKFAASLERFTSKAMEKNTAIDEFNQLIAENNEIVVWGQGKVTNGACGSPKQTEIIGKAIGTTKNLIEEYRRVLQ